MNNLETNCDGGERTERSSVIKGETTKHIQ